MSALSTSDKCECRHVDVGDNNPSGEGINSPKGDFGRENANDAF